MDLDKELISANLTRDAWKSEFEAQFKRAEKAAQETRAAIETSESRKSELMNVINRNIILEKMIKDACCSKDKDKEEIGKLMGKINVLLKEVESLERTNNVLLVENGFYKKIIEGIRDCLPNRRGQ